MASLLATMKSLDLKNQLTEEAQMAKEALMVEEALTARLGLTTTVRIDLRPTKPLMKIGLKGMLRIH